MKKIILSILFVVFIVCICGCQSNNNIITTVETEQTTVAEKTETTEITESTTEDIEITEVVETETEDITEDVVISTNTYETTEHTETITDTTYEPTESIVEPTTEEYNVVYSTTDEYSAIIIAKTIYGEARGIWSITEQACIAWTILNRVDCYSGTVESIVTEPNQFAYSYYFPTVDDFGRDLVSLAKDVMGRWEAEKNGIVDVGRVLPSDYMWYGGNGYHNYFRNSYEGGNTWDYSLGSPYES